MGKWLIRICIALLAGHAAAAEVTLYEQQNFGGRRFEADWPVEDFARYGFADTASSLVIARGAWLACSEPGFRGSCVTLAPGRYPSLAAIGLNNRISSLRPAGVGGGPGGPGGPVARGAITFYEHDHFQGRGAGANAAVLDFSDLRMNDEVSSVVIERYSWQLCTDSEFRGRCVVLAPGRYESLSAMGLNDMLSSARPVFDGQPGGDITFFEHSEFRGQRIDGETDIVDFLDVGFNDRVSSVVVNRGRWQICSDGGYRGRCVVLEPGLYPRLDDLQMNDVVSSARRLRGWGGGWGPGSLPEEGSPAISACSAAVEERIHRERPRSGRVQLFQGGLVETQASREETSVSGPGQVEMPGGWRRFRFECTVQSRTGRVVWVRITD